MIVSAPYSAWIKDIQFHDYSNLHPKMNEDQFNGLKHALMDNGQQQPVILYRGKLIDGRHRIWALKDNNVETVDCVDLPRNTKLSEVRKYIMMTEKRRHQSKNQLLCAAYLDFINPKTEAKTLSHLALDYGVSSAGLSQAKKVAEEFGIKIIHSFVIGDKVNIAVNEAFANYSSVASIYAAMKRAKTEHWARSQRQAAIGFNEYDERGRVRAFCVNDTLDLLKFKQRELLDLIVTKETAAQRLAEEFS